MLDIHDLPLFITASLVFCLTPGPDILYVLGRSLAQGRRAGALSALGVAVGVSVHVTAAPFGLSAIPAASATAYAVVKYCGAAYLIYLGVKTLLSRRAPLEAPEEYRRLSDRAIFWQGALTNVLNPKVALFFMAFLPQFIDPQGAHRTLSFLCLGAILLIIGLVNDLAYAFFSSGLTRLMRRSARVNGWLNGLMGVTFLGLGLRLASDDR